jgi:hypothetical protein
MVTLSKSTINRRIDDMSHNAEEVLGHKLKNNSFSIQADESTDLTNKCYIVAFVSDIEIQENFSVAKSYPKEARGKVYLNVLSSYLKKKVCLERTV